MTPSLSTTAYAALGMLALRPLSAYELTQQMQRSLDYCWPISERALYGQPERLVSAGLAEVVDTGPPPRRRYAITAAGLAELQRWLGTDSAMPRFQNEPLLRVLYADQGSLDDLQRVVAALRTHTAERRRQGIAQLRPYLDGEGLYQERAHIVTIVADLVARLLATIEDWANDTERLTAEWAQTSDVGLTPQIRALLSAMLEREEARERAADGARRQTVV